jgi:hypothetical protein
MASFLSFFAQRFWPQATVAPEPAPVKKLEPVSEPAALEDPLPYIPSGHDHTSRHGRPRRNITTLVRLARDGLLSTEEECWIQVPNSSNRAYYTLRLLGLPRNIVFHAGKPEDNGSIVGCYPDHVVRDFYNDQTRMAGWCAIHLSGHGDMTLCQFHDENTA